MADSNADRGFMAKALELAEQGRGAVEPNPLVGCVVVRDGRIVGQGYHQRFGGPHAEIEALSAAGAAARGAEVFVTLEPCCHQGKTGPCTEALIEAQIARVVVGCQDPNPQVAGQGLSALRGAGIDVSMSALAKEASQLIAPFTKLITTGRSWVIAKWAMTLDGKIATHAGNSQWISSEASRAVVHRLRGQVDAILVGRRTAAADDPLLNARPPGPRTATRVVVDSRATLSLESKLVQSIDEAPLLVATTSSASQQNRQRLVEQGAEVIELKGSNRSDQMAALLGELGHRKMTNLLVEGGSEVFGTLFDMRAIDEVHAFVAPRIVGGAAAPSPVGGEGCPEVAAGVQLERTHVETLDGDLHIHGYPA